MDTSTGEEDTVTMMDVLQEQEELEENANAVLGSSDDKNCTYSEGYIKRQALYACQTCTEDNQNAAAICLACSLKCHDKHELVELYTKRNFRCDCPTCKFTESHTCTFVPEKMPENKENRYNQNFQGLYCICHRPYPDPESTEQEKMIQCVICEDWLHSSHLEARVPQDDLYSEMICKSCMITNDFLYDYPDLMVECDSTDNDLNGSCENTLVDVCENDETENNIENDTNSIQPKITDIQVQQDTTNHAITIPKEEATESMTETVSEKATESMTETVSEKATDNTNETLLKEATDNAAETLTKGATDNTSGTLLNEETDKTTESLLRENAEDKTESLLTDNVTKLTEEIDENKDILDQINEVCNETSEDSVPINGENETKKAEELSMDVDDSESANDPECGKLDAEVSDAVNQPEDNGVTCDEAEMVDNVSNIGENESKDETDITSKEPQEKDTEKGDLIDFTESKPKEQNADDETQQNTMEINNQPGENMDLNNDKELEKKDTHTENDLAAETNIQLPEQKSSVEDLENSQIIEKIEEGMEKLDAIPNIEENVKESSDKKTEENTIIDQCKDGNNKEQTAPEIIEKEHSMEDLDSKQTHLKSTSVENEAKDVEALSEDIVDEKPNDGETKTELPDQFVSGDKTEENTGSGDQKIDQPEHTLVDQKSETKDSNLLDNPVGNQLESVDDTEQTSDFDSGVNEHESNNDPEAELKNSSESLDQVDDDLGGKNDTNEQNDTEISKDDAIENNEKVSETTLKDSDLGKESDVDVEMPSENVENDTEMVHETIQNNSDLEKESNIDAEMPIKSTEKPTKRKFDEAQKQEMKKPKLESQECIRRQNTNVKPKGATFWICNWRTKLCTCNVCIAMYKDLEVLYLLDPDDTVTAYEEKGKEKNGHMQSQYEQGLHAFQSQFDRVEQINALTEYNTMKDKLVEFLQWFKDNKKVVKEEDVKRFFSRMKPTKRDDGVYFCI